MGGGGFFSFSCLYAYFNLSQVKLRIGLPCRVRKVVSIWSWLVFRKLKLRCNAIDIVIFSLIFFLSDRKRYKLFYLHLQNQIKQFYALLNASFTDRKMYKQIKIEPYICMYLCKLCIYGALWHLSSIAFMTTARDQITTTCACPKTNSLHGSKPHYITDNLE